MMRKVLLLSFFVSFCFVLASCAGTVFVEDAKAEPLVREPLVETEQAAPPEFELAGDYDVFNSLDMKTQHYGLIKEGHYYWGTIRVGSDKRLHFYVDEQFRESHVYQESVVEGVNTKSTKKDSEEDSEKNGAKTFPAFGTLPLDGSLSHIYFYTAKESGYLFSGSLAQGSGLTSLLPQYYTKRFANVCFVKR